MASKAASKETLGLALISDASGPAASMTTIYCNVSSASPPRLVANPGDVIHVDAKQLARSGRVSDQITVDWRLAYVRVPSSLRCCWCPITSSSRLIAPSNPTNRAATAIVPARPLA